jgi:hypothetical protein
MTKMEAVLASREAWIRNDQGVRSAWQAYERARSALEAILSAGPREHEVSAAFVGRVLTAHAAFEPVEEAYRRAISDADDEFHSSVIARGLLEQRLPAPMNMPR